jgi:dienelactone hydrolase
VVSFHGVLATNAPASAGRVKAGVLVLTGANDPFTPPDHVTAFENECAQPGFVIGRLSPTATPIMPSPILQQTGLSSRARSSMSNRTADRG